MTRKYIIVQNVDLTAQKIIILLSTEQAMQAEANSNTIPNVTLSLDLHFSIFPSGLSGCILGLVSSAHEQMPGHWWHSHHCSDVLGQGSGQAVSLEVQMPIVDAPL